MTESDLKRAIARSIRFQGGVGHRTEDRFAVGWPDMVLIPKGLPVFFTEAKLLHGAKLGCTPMQGLRLLELQRPPHAFGIIVGYCTRRERLYAGHNADKLEDCVSVVRPKCLDSSAWPITTLLCWYLERHKSLATLTKLEENVIELKR